MAILAALAITACGDSVFRSDYSAWKGHQIDELIASWGEATNVRQIGNEMTVYTWREAGSECEHSFTVQGQRIAGISDTDCE